ncbi:hypothetical protein [Escherichia phage 6947]|nr:hypothetical protein [Escherichia phage 6947]
MTPNNNNFIILHILRVKVRGEGDVPHGCPTLPTRVVFDVA